MSSTSFATVQWGGTIIRNQFGYDYEDGQSIMFEFGNISTCDELRATIERELNITGNLCIQNLMYRQPVAACGCIMYNIVEVNTDATVRIIQQFARQFGSTAFVQFYVTVNERQVINDSVGGGSNVGEDDVGVDNQYEPSDDIDDDGSSDEEDDSWPDSNDGDEEDDGGDDMDDYYNIHCNNPSLPLVHPPPYSEIDFDMQVDTTTKPGHMCFDASKEFQVGMVFPTREAVQLAAKEYSLRRNHQFRNCESKLRKYVIMCGNPNEPCGWKLRATTKEGDLFWKIVTYSGPHTCQNAQMSTDHRQLDQKYLCSQIQAMIAADPTMKIKPLIAEIKDKLGFEPSYRKTWAAKQMAIEKTFGGWDESYGQLRRTMNAMKFFNPGSHFVIDSDMAPNQSCEVFNRMFWTFRQTIEGFQSCRPVIFVDGTFLHGKYRGMLICATSLDGNNHTFPLAFAIVDRENVDNWCWFMDLLRIYVTNDRENICVISDRHIGIQRAMETEGWRPPHGHHRYCIRHIVSNYNKHFKNPEGKRAVQMAGTFFNLSKFSFLYVFIILCDSYVLLLLCIAYENQERKFLRTMARMRQLHPETADWCDQLPREKWTKAYDEGRRYGAMTTNLVESVNAMLKNVRCLPITAMVEKIFHQLVYYFDTRRTTYRAQQNDHGWVYTEFAARIIAKNSEDANGHDVTRFDSDTGIFEVKTGYDRSRGRGGNKQRVKLDERTCTCGKFEEMKIPCSHVIAVCQKYAIDYQAFVDDFYRLDRTLQCYRYMFHPLGNPDYWPQLHELPLVPHPSRIRKKGRPRALRIRNEMDWSMPSSSSARR